jgi:hypothetical protein
MAQPSEAASKAARQTWLRHIADQRAFDRELAKILRDASREAERMITATIGDTVSAQLRRAQLQVAVSQLQLLSNQMWGSITPAMEAAARRAVDLGIEGVITLDAILADALADPALRTSFLEGAQSAANNVRSRLLNDIQLSPNVYRTQALSNKWVARAVNRGLALNLSSREIAKSVRGMINPNTPGGVSYAARRLARTEINNAFHTTTIRAAANEPWNEGFKWNLSSSHPRPDPCNPLAEDDHDGLGAGVFKPKNVPGKPHPQCLCYLTVVQIDDDVFIDKLVNGDYDDYLSS